MLQQTALVYSDEFIRNILETCKTIALVGASPKPNRDSYQVMAYLQARGYRILPVNPVCAGQMILGETVIATLAEINVPFQMVDVFRKTDAIPDVAREVLELSAVQKIDTFWMQLDIRHDEVAQKLEKAGIKVVMDRCPKIEYARLLV